MSVTLERASFAALAALLALHLGWHLWLAPPQRLPLGFVLALAVVPLGLVLAGALIDRHRALFWGVVLALVYFSHGVMEAWVTPAVRALALSEALLAVAAVGCAGAHAIAARREASHQRS